MNFISRVASWVGGGVMSDASGQQISTPNTIETETTSPDRALQVSAVYACAKLLANVVSSLPLMVYETNQKGQRVLSRGSNLWIVLHEQPNEVMTPADFWMAMVLQWALRGNAYAQIIRDKEGDLVGLWPLSSDQMSVFVYEGKVYYRYFKDNENTILERKDVLHIKDIGSGLMGFSKLEFMNASVSESISLQRFATANAKNFGKPSGVITVDHVMDAEQREKIRNQLFDFKTGGCAKLAVLEADMKFQQVALTPEQSQLIENRHYSTEEICRWFGVPPVLIGASGATTWGSGIAEIMSGFHKFTLGPLLKSIEQALMSRVLTDEQRETVTVEFSLDALLRGDIATRYDAYAKAVQNGFKTRNEVRQLENDEPLPGGDELTAQTNLAPLHMLGKIPAAKQTQVTEVKQ